MKVVEAPISIGELFDKITILEIKIEKGFEGAQDELNQLLTVGESLVFPKSIVCPFIDGLKAINETLWGVEDKKREHERQKCFDEEFIELSRAVYILNDHRAYLKRMINNFSGSKIKEYKSHTDYS
jgi:hypothetical protein